MTIELLVLTLNSFTFFITADISNQTILKLNHQTKAVLRTLSIK
jgi:hypothetical protein